MYYWKYKDRWFFDNTAETLPILTSGVKVLIRQRNGDSYILIDKDGEFPDFCIEDMTAIILRSIHYKLGPIVADLSGPM